MDGFVLGKILGNTFPHPHKILKPTETKWKSEEEKKHATVLGNKLQLFSFGCAIES